ncbi:TRAP transporter substrate-binding protein [Agromyces aurantiacus]|uniref:TRAP transporter substrate-binding protein n=1 Tax=Agromyces aurantiacus TaxID=165814 RepID=A0ABV9R106_9MICO|nr:hypothetical protein [Agromyces aurantiacus]MBM7505930.1 TRAP-type C4-dicarboxylate transport system substrate-binding protein [Agromyces aurantiacus]
MRATDHTLAPASAAAAAVAAAIVLAVSGCTTGTAPAADLEPVTLELFHIDGGPELDPAVDWYVDRVAELSDGAITIEVVRSCCGDAIDVEEQLVTAVADGDADLGWVGTRVFAELGVTALAAMTAPMLVDDYELQQDAAASDAAREALGGLDELGVAGIAVLPGSLRSPLASDAPVRTLADWQGRTIASFHSEAAVEALRQLGAEPLDVGFEERDAGLYDGTISTLENSFVMLDLDREHIVPNATVNLALWPRSSALIANPALAEQLGEGGMAILEEAAADVVERTSEFAGMDQAAIESACTAGARFAVASDSELAAMRDAVAESYDAIAGDPAAAPLLDAIEELKDARGPAAVPEIPAGCEGEAAAVGAAAPSGDVAALDGAFETPELTEAKLVELGMPPEEAAKAAGTFRFTFDQGTFALDADGTNGGPAHCDGSYTVDGGRVTISVRGGGDCGPGGTVFVADFAVDATGLTFTNVQAPMPSDAVLFADYRWTRVS